MTTIEIIGQIIGIFAVVALFSAYQMKNRKWLLLLQMLGVALIATQYFMINAISGAVLNAVCLVRTIFFYFTEGKITNETLRKYVFPLSFSILVCVFAVLFWEGWYTWLMLVCLGVNSFCTGACMPQSFRFSLLFTCALAFAYNVIVFSIGGMINEVLSVISAIVGIIRYKNQLKENA